MSKQSKSFVESFQPSEALINQRMKIMKQVALENKCFCGAEKIFARMTEEELKAAVRAGIIQILFFEYIGATDGGTDLYFGYVGHLVYALQAKETDILTSSIIH